MTEAFVLAVLGVSAYHDIRTMKIPDMLSVFLLGYGFFYGIFYGSHILLGLKSFFTVLIFMLAISFCCDFLLSLRGETGSSLGGGDIKLISSLAFVLGTETAVFILLVSQLLCLCYAFIYCIAYRKYIRMLPLAPFLLAAYIITIFLGG